MAAPYNPPKKNKDFEFDLGLQDSLDPLRLKANPTLASGDFKVSKDGGAFANLTNLPTVLPASGKNVHFELTSTEMNADSVVIVGSDQTDPPEWPDFQIGINTTA